MTRSLAIDRAPIPFDSLSTLDDEVFTNFLELYAKSLCAQDPIPWGMLSEEARGIYRAIAISQSAMNIVPVWSMNEDEGVENVQ